MRLLKSTENDNFSLSTFSANETPPYAILSHTWGKDEVTFEEIINNEEKDKPGYQKIKFCEKQASKDGLSYFWIDTCCIDKTDIVETSEAINSMFSWYRDAARCYVYLSDVVINEANATEHHSESTWLSRFCVSRWFTRGWTLQELLAPPTVHFFSREGRLLGDKVSLETQIHGITGIPIRALRGANLSTFSVEERLSWTQGRSTTRREDKVYSLLGLFNVRMPMLYGEGEEFALQRLKREIARSISQSFFNVCFPRDRDFVGREDLLQQMKQKMETQGTRIALCGLGGVG
jgi:hypothetical protein